MDHSNARKPWQQYVRLLRPEAADLRTIVVYGAASAVLSLAVPLAVDALISNIVFGTLLTPLVVIVGALLGCLLLQGVMRALQALVAEIIERRIFARVVGDLTWRLPRVDIRAFDRDHGPELVNRFFDTMTVQKSSSKLFLEVTNIVLTTTVGLVVLGLYHPALLAFSAAMVVAIAFLVFGLGVGGVRTSVDESIAKYRVGAWLQELARHTTAFCTRGGADFARRRSEQLTASYLHARRRHYRVVFRQICSAVGLQVLASTAVLALGGWLVIDQQLTAGQLVASELIVTAVVANLVKFASALETWYDVCAAADKLGHLIDLPLERQDGTPTASTGGGVALRLDAVTCGGSDDLDVPPFDLEVAPGERVALLAPIGGSASRLLDVLFGLRQPASGHATIDGIDLRQLRLDETRDQFALVHGAEIVEGTILDNIRFGRELDPAAVTLALRDVALWDEVMQLPLGLETQLTVYGNPLTTSQASRLMLARAIVGEPRLLLLDGALDTLTAATRRQVLAHLLERRHAWTMLVVTTLPEVAAACDRSLDLQPATIGDAGGAQIDLAPEES